MPKEFVVKLQNEPGTFARLTRVLADASVNILGIECQTLGDYGTAHFVVNEEDRAERALTDAGMQYRAYNAVTVRLPNKPGALAEACERIAAAGVNIDGIFGTTSLREDEAEFVIKVHDAEGALAALEDTREADTEP